MEVREISALTSSICNKELRPTGRRITNCHVVNDGREFQHSSDSLTADRRGAVRFATLTYHRCSPFHERGRKTPAEDKTEILANGDLEFRNQRFWDMCAITDVEQLPILYLSLAL